MLHALDYCPAANREIPDQNRIPGLICPYCNAALRGATNEGDQEPSTDSFLQSVSIAEIEWPRVGVAAVGVLTVGAAFAVPFTSTVSEDNWIWVLVIYALLATFGYWIILRAADMPPSLAIGAPLLMLGPLGLLFAAFLGLFMPDLAVWLACLAGFLSPLGLALMLPAWPRRT